MELNLRDLDHIIADLGKGTEQVIPILQAIQLKYNFLPEEALRYICDNTNITAEQITGVGSFYSQFRMEPAGEHIIKVCVGTACHVKGAGLIHDAIIRELNLEGARLTDERGMYTLEKVSCLGCCTIAPVVQIDQVTYGHVAPDQVGKVIKDFEENKKSDKKGLFRKADGSEIAGEIRIGLGSCCVASGSDEIRDAVQDVVDTKHLPVKLKHVGCVGMCHQVPLVEVIPVNGDVTLYAKVKPEDVSKIVNRHFAPPGLLNRWGDKLMNLAGWIQDDSNWDGIDRYSIDYRDKPVSAFLGKQVPIATEHRGVINPLDLAEYKSKSGFLALKKALKEMTPEEVINEVRNSGTRGRGGAGFSTGTKWELAARAEGEIKYLICNGDEGDPGAFMDRMLMESYPYRMLEGILIAAYATGIHQGYVYLRAEYPLAVTRIKKAVEILKEEGLIGDNILDSGFSFDLRIYEGAGAFVCGEETALMASIEGKRGFPKARPPYPVEKGLFGNPTLVNNVETFSVIPFIIRSGADRFNSIGTETSKGTKVFALAGKVARGGLIEVPMGISIREIVEEIGGGVPGGKKFKAVQIGGPSGGCIPAELADAPIDFESLKELGAMMGSGGMVVLDEDDCMVDIAHYFLSFTQNESCGKCTFCRVGTKRMLDILDRLTSGKAKKGDLEELENLADWTKKGSLCGLGKSAPNPILSTLRYFREEYEAHLNGNCPTGKCAELIEYHITDDCIGCTLCAQKCPVNAIPFDPHNKHIINTDLCIKCDTCRIVCPEEAIIKR
ncbi:MAG: NAD(P)H-dependent oxidoreductase subunit E [Bacteroidales bacterium]|nr:NAD(P)H-dependent oxidoreductase subunit E [Bacteroidales bacterium]